MISLEQIKQLQEKVNRAVSRMSALQEENNILYEKLDACEKRVTELEAFIEDFRTEQRDIEEGIISALTHLDTLEKAVSTAGHETVSVQDATASSKDLPEKQEEPEDEALTENASTGAEAPVEVVPPLTDVVETSEDDADFEAVGEGETNRQLDIF